MTLYDKFFRTGFKETTEQLGIVFTPVEVVDFIVKSVDYALNKYFGKRLASKNVHVLDPFTGTGTFITRTLQYLKEQMEQGKITFADILRKYNNELHANEIVLLSYYIASINIEAVFDEVNGPDRGYEPFKGIVLTDTFESTEREDSFADKLLGENNERLRKQQEQPITAIIGNPPYSVGQKNANDDNQNTHYLKLEESIKQTYVKNSSSGLSMSVYDSYVKAFRWASDRIGKQGVIGFITNSGYLDSNSTDGLRKSLHDEFNKIYLLNLRGAIRSKSGISAKKEGKNIFNIMTGVAIVILVKDGSSTHDIYYHDIGDFLDRKEKLDILQGSKSIKNIAWNKITPDSNNDWINQRDPRYRMYTALAGEENSIFGINAIGVKTNRDIWVSGFSENTVVNNVSNMLDYYNVSLGKIDDYTKLDKTKIKLSDKLIKEFDRGSKLTLDISRLRLEMYRPYTKKWIMYDNKLVDRPGKWFNSWGRDNLTIITTGRGSNKEFSVYVANEIPCMDLLEKAQGFMKYDNSAKTEQLFVDRNNINQKFADKLSLSLDDTFAYVYGLLNSKEYQAKYANDLKKDLARIPIVKDKEKYVEIGKKLMNLHINYEKVPMYDGISIESKSNPSYEVKKMKFAKVKKSEKDRSTIIFNTDITIRNIPDKAYEYIVNGRSAIEWIMDQYQVKTDKKTGITDNPNDFSDDPKYIFNLLLRIINVSVQTVDLVNSLPKLEIIE